MSQLRIEDIEKLADLAKIEITIAEKEQYLKDINNILGHISMISSADLGSVENTFRFSNNVRADALDKRDFDLNLIYQNIPSKSTDNFVKVSKVIKK